MTDFELGVRRIVREVRTELALTAPPNGHVVTIHATVGDPEPGFWCDTCLLPSAAEMTLSGLHEGGIFDLGRVRACPDCGQIERVG